jgi:hypothetical protein
MFIDFYERPILGATMGIHMAVTGVQESEMSL